MLVFTGLLTSWAVIETFLVDGSLSDAYSFATHSFGVYFVMTAFFSQFVFFQPFPVGLTCLPAGVFPQMHQAGWLQEIGESLWVSSQTGQSFPHLFQGFHISAFAFLASLWFYAISHSWFLGAVCSCFHCFFFHGTVH